MFNDIPERNRVIGMGREAGKREKTLNGGNAEGLRYIADRAFCRIYAVRGKAFFTLGILAGLTLMILFM